MKPLYLLACLLISVLYSAHAQTNYEFTYDACGNRLTRAVITLKSATTPDSIFAQIKDEIQEDMIGLQKVRIYPNPTKGLIRIDLPTLTIINE
jgi:hypothetical protein